MLEIAFAPRQSYTYEAGEAREAREARRIVQSSRQHREHGSKGAGGGRGSGERGRSTVHYSTLPSFGVSAGTSWPLCKLRHETIVRPRSRHTALSAAYVLQRANRRGERVHLYRVRPIELSEFVDPGDLIHYTRDRSYIRSGTFYRIMPGDRIYSFLLVFFIHFY